MSTDVTSLFGKLALHRQEDGAWSARTPQQATQGRITRCQIVLASRKGIVQTFEFWAGQRNRAVAITSENQGAWMLLNRVLDNLVNTQKLKGNAQWESQNDALRVTLWGLSGRELEEALRWIVAAIIVSI